MSTVPSKKQRKRLIQLLDDLMWLFSVQNMERAVSFKETQKGIRLAEVEIEENYQRLTIDIYPLFWDSSLKDQRKTIITEFVHYFNF